MGNLTKRESMILTYIKDYMLEHNATPSVKEIAEEEGIAKQTAYAHLYALEKKGYVEFRGWSNYSVKGMKFVEDKQ